MVLDVPWIAAALDPAKILVAPAEPERLAELLDVPVASSLKAEVDSTGEYVAWADLPALALAADQLGIALPDGGVLLHDPLTVTVDGETAEVPWWSDDRLHAADTSEGWRELSPGRATGGASVTASPRCWKTQRRAPC